MAGNANNANNAAEALNRMTYQNEINATPFTVTFISDSDSILKWICNVKTHVDKFDQNVPRDLIFKQIVNSMPNPTIRLYKIYVDYQCCRPHIFCLSWNPVNGSHVYC